MKDELNLDEIEKDAFGFPLPGPIIRAFRQRMTYFDNDGVEKYWSQSILGEKLGLSEVSVRLMETKNIGLESINRRRALADLLKIPPALLGLATIPQLDAVFKGPTVSNVIVSKHSGISQAKIAGYTDDLSIYNGYFADRTIRASIDNVEALIVQIAADVQNARSSQTPMLQRILCDFHLLAAKTYGYDFYDWPQASNHLGEHLQIATLLKSPDLAAKNLYLSARLRQDDKPVLANIDIEGALQYAEKGTNSTKGVINALASILCAKCGTDLASQTKAQKLIDKAENYADSSDEFRTFDKGWFLKHKAETCIALGRYGKALETIEDSEDLQTGRRELEYLNILRAECFVRQKSQELEEATRILLQVVANNTYAKEQIHLKQVDKLFKILNISKYGNHPDVVDLGLQLRQLQQK